MGFLRNNEFFKVCVTSLTYNANNLIQSTLPWRQHLHTVWLPPPKETNAGNKQATNMQARRGWGFCG